MNIVVTGASSGIGRSTVESLAASGMHTIFALSRNGKLLNELSEDKGNIIPVVCDLSVDNSVIEAVELIGSKAETVEVLIHNAGRLLFRPFDILTNEDWKEIYETNVFGPVRLTKGLLPLLKKGNLSSDKDQSHIVMISSAGGINGTQKFSGLSAYSSSKGAVTILAECLAEEFRPFAIAVNCLALGSVDTEMFRAAFPGIPAGNVPGEIGDYIADFALNGWKLFNGRTIQVSHTTP